MSFHDHSESYPGGIPPVLLWAKGVHLGDLRVYAILDRLDVWDRGIVQVSHLRIAQLYESTPAIVGRHLRNLAAVGALEVLYPGRYSGRAAGAPNTYRLIHKVPAEGPEQRASTRVANARPRAQPLRAPARAISSPSENGRVTRRDRSQGSCPHPYPCSCAECTEWIDNQRADVRYDSDRES